jgi:rhodanese-related sulfurtransferase
MAKPMSRCTVAAMGESMLSPRTAWALLQDGRAQLIDLGGRDEIDLPRIPGACAIPLDEPASELATLDREPPVVFVSGRGRNATAAMEVLRSAGITAWAVEGGMRAWLHAGRSRRCRPGSAATGIIAFDEVRCRGPTVVACMLAAVAVRGYGGSHEPSDQQMVTEVLHSYLGAQASGDGQAACALLTADAQRQLIALIVKADKAWSLADRRASTRPALSARSPARSS